MLLPGLAPYDAVSNDALGMTAALRTFGHDVVLFALHAKDIDEPVQPPETIERWIESPDDVVIYHYCTGWDFPLQLLRRLKARRVLRYHNITPPEFFGVDPGAVPGLYLPLSASLLINGASQRQFVDQN